MKTLFPTLTTPRLILRELTLNDAAEIADLRSSEQVNKYLDRPETTNLDEAVTFINKINDSIKNGGFYWVIALKTAPQLIGTICLWNANREDSTIEIGYELHPDHHSKGIMQEAMSVVIAYTFQTLHFDNIVAFPHPANEKSIALLAKNNFIADENSRSEHEIIYSLKSPANFY